MLLSLSEFWKCCRVGIKQHNNNKKGLGFKKTSSGRVLAFLGSVARWLFAEGTGSGVGWRDQTLGAGGGWVCRIVEGPAWPMPPRSAFPMAFLLKAFLPLAKRCDSAFFCFLEGGFNNQLEGTVPSWWQGLWGWARSPAWDGSLPFLETLVKSKSV